MKNRSLLLLLGVLLGTLSPTISWAGGVFNTLSLRSSRSTLLADGKQSTDIIAEVRDSSGRIAGSGVSVQFQTTLGTQSAADTDIFWHCKSALN